MHDDAPQAARAREHLVIENELAYVRYDSSSLSRGHVLVVPIRHVAGFFDLNPEEHEAILALLRQARSMCTCT